MESAQIYLEAQNLTCIRDDRVLFSGLSFSVRARQVLLIEGRNGCGKTSLLRILCGFREADEGVVNWCGRRASRSSYNTEMAFVGHTDGVKKELSVLENLRVTEALGKPGQYNLQQVLQKVSLQGYDDTLVQSLSAGQRRRLSLARLLVNDSILWILDEPFTSLDKQGIELIETFMYEHVEGGGMIVMTSHHDLRLSGIDVRRMNLSACL